MGKISINTKNPNCFAFGGNKCLATTNKSCDKCPFFKTKRQNDIENNFSHARAVEKGYYQTGLEYEPKRAGKCKE